MTVSAVFMAKFPLAILFSLTLFSSGEGMTRCHRGPKNKNGVAILRGRALTDANGSPADTGSHARHVVDFSIHLKTDIIIWEELSEDGIRIESCSFPEGASHAKIRLSGKKLDQTDFARGVVLAIEKADLEIGCKKELPSAKEADEADSYWFYRIKRSKNIGDETVLLTVKMIQGMKAVPVIDISVHEKDASKSEIEGLRSFVFEDSPGNDETSSRIAPLYDQNANTFLPMSDKLQLFKKTIPVLGGVSMEVSGSVNAGIRNFRLTRVSGLHFEWDQTLSASLSASLLTRVNLYRSKRTGSLYRAYIPNMSFSLSIPLVGKIQAGAFLGVNWITELDVSANTRLTFNARYQRYERVRASVIPPSYNAENRLPPGTGASSTTTVSVGSSSSVRLNGFYGLRPLIGAGITYTKRKVSFRWFKIKIATETKSVNGNLGANVGLQLYAGYRSTSYPPYSGSGIKIGVCHTCHLLQGSAYFRGKTLSVQTVVSGKVTAERVLVSNLFSIRLGTICALQRVCPLRRQLERHSTYDSMNESGSEPISHGVVPVKN